MNKQVVNAETQEVEFVGSMIECIEYISSLIDAGSDVYITNN